MLLNMLTPQQFEEWGHFYALEPWGVDVDDFRFSMMASLAAAFVGTKDFDATKLTVANAARELEAQVIENLARAEERKLDRMFGLTDGSDETEAQLDNIFGVH